MCVCVSACVCVSVCVCVSYGRVYVHVVRFIGGDYVHVEKFIGGGRGVGGGIMSRLQNKFTRG